jgi:putative thiamine transport system ATP-binding protein
MRGLSLRGASVALGGRTLVGPLDLAVAPGAVVTLMGPSGSGKSSLLGWLCGTLDPVFRSAGRVMLDGEDVTARPAHLRRIGILFQDDMLFPHLSVGGNLAFGLPATVRGAERRARIAAALADAELAGFENRDPATLSGGQRARIALMRTLLAEPRALLLDEPFGRLDVALRERMRRFVFERARRLSLPVLMVTHDPEDAASAGGAVLHLLAGGAVRRAEPEGPLADALPA